MNPNPKLKQEAGLEEDLSFVLELSMLSGIPIRELEQMTMRGLEVLSQTLEEIIPVKYPRLPL